MASSTYNSDFPMPCPNKCNIEVANQDDLKEHLQVCSFEKVLCPQCGAVRARKYFEEHEITKKFEPQYCLQRQFDKLQMELKEMIKTKLKVEEKVSLKVQSKHQLVVAVAIVAVAIIIIVANGYLSNNSGLKSFEQPQLMNVQLALNVLQQLNELQTNISKLWNHTIANRTFYAAQLQEVKDKQHLQQQETRVIKINITQLKNDTVVNQTLYSLQLQEVKDKQHLQQQELRVLKTNITQLRNDAMVNQTVYTIQLQEVKDKQLHQHRELNKLQTKISQLRNDTIVNQTVYVTQLQEVKYYQSQQRQELSELKSNFSDQTCDIALQLQELKHQQQQEINKVVTNISHLHDSVIQNQALPQNITTEMQHKITLILESLSSIITISQRPQVEEVTKVESLISSLQTAHILSKQIYEKRPLDPSALWRLLLLLSPYSDGDHVAPVILKMSNFIKKVTYKEKWNSEPFFAFKGGHKVCLKVYFAGYGDGEGTHVSVYLYLMKGPYDDNLEQSGQFPLRGTFTIELLNQLKDENHHIHNVTFNDSTCAESASRVVDGNMASKGWGEPQFIYHDDFIVNNRYLGIFNLYFRISWTKLLINKSDCDEKQKDAELTQASPIMEKFEDDNKLLQSVNMLWSILVVFMLFVIASFIATKMVEY